MNREQASPKYLEHDWFPRPLPSNVRIGERSWLDSTFAFLHYQSQCPCGVSIGDDCGLYNGTFFDLGPEGEVQIGDYTAIVGAIISSNCRIVIGNYVFVAHEVVLADFIAAVPPPASAGQSDHMADEACADEGACIVLGDNCWIGTRAVLLAGAIIGEGAIIGAAAVVDFKVPPYAIVAGNPARIVGWARGGRSS